jgi:hypothetical protein
MRGHNPRLRWWACEPVAQLVEQRPFKPIEAFSTFPSVSSKKRTKPLQTLAFKPVSSLQRHARKCREMRRFWCQSYAKLRTRRARTGCVVCGRGGVVIVAYSVNVAIRRGRVVARLVIVPLARCTVKAPQVGHGCACTPRQRADDSPTDGARLSESAVDQLHGLNRRTTLGTGRAISTRGDSQDGGISAVASCPWRYIPRSTAGRGVG